jgi:hypothetical protein
MNIAAMLEPTQVVQYPRMTSASSSPLQPSLQQQQQQQRLPSISHVTAALHQHQFQPLSSHNMQQHVQIMPQPQPLASAPPPRQVLPPRVDSMSSVNSSTQGSVEQSTRPHPSSSSQHSATICTVRRDSSASSSNTNPHQRRRPGGQTKAACLPCRKRKSKVRSFCSLVIPESYTFDLLFSFPLFFLPLIRSSHLVLRPMLEKEFPLTSCNSVMAPALPANAAPQSPPCATTASPPRALHSNRPSKTN